jgi:hypothetical protein
MKRFNILYDGEVIHRNLSHEKALEVLQDLSERYYESTSEKTRQGRSALTKLAATSRNKAKKKYRGQG